MPDIDDTRPAGGGLTITLTIQRLQRAHATVRALDNHPGVVSALFGTVDQRVELLDDLPVVRQLLTDAVAQLDAIAAQGGE